MVYSFNKSLIYRSFILITILRIEAFSLIVLTFKSLKYYLLATALLALAATLEFSDSLIETLNSAYFGFFIFPLTV